jgi:hypothetical protein
MKKDWVGNKATAFSQIGTIYKTKQTNPNRSVDFYATHPQAVRDLLRHEDFSNVWEIADGAGHICKEISHILTRHSDVVDRGCRVINNWENIDFLKYDGIWNGDIITNPPYRWGLEFARKALEIIPEGNRVAMLLKIQFLEGKKRRGFLRENPPRYVYVWSGRMTCALNGNFENITHGSPMMFSWFVWYKGYKGNPEIKWID